MSTIRVLATVSIFAALASIGLAEEGFEGDWEALASEDLDKVSGATDRFLAGGDRAREFLAARLSGTEELDLAERVTHLVDGLSADSYEDREAAAESLAGLGPAALPHLVRIRGSASDLETCSRLDGIVAGLNTRIEREWETPGRARRWLDGLHLLAILGGPDAERVLRAHLEHPSGPCRQVAHAGLAWLVGESPLPDPARPFPRPETRAEAWAALAPRPPLDGTGLAFAWRVPADLARAETWSSTEFTFLPDPATRERWEGKGNERPELSVSRRSSFSERLDSEGTLLDMVSDELLTTTRFRRKVSQEKESLSGSLVRIRTGPPIEVSTDEGPVGVGRKALLAPGQLTRWFVPGGDYGAGVVRDLDGESAAQLVRFLTDWPEPRIARAAARARLVSREGDRLDFAIWLDFLAANPAPRPRDVLSGGIRLWLAGIVVAEPATGLVRSYRFEGAYTGNMNERGDRAVLEAVFATAYEVR